MANTDIELVDGKFGHVRIPLGRRTRKIKSKQSSFNNISARWKNFRLNRLKSKLISDKEKLVSMEFKNSQLVSENGREKAENKVLKKTTAIAKLESKIQFLETGRYSTEEFVNSRAIKLKNMMMSNLVYNRDSLYSVNKDTAEKILEDVQENAVNTEPAVAQAPVAGENSTMQEEMSEQQEAIAREVQRIMDEDQNKNKSVAETPEDVQELPIAIPTEGAVAEEEATENAIEVPKKQVDQAEVSAAINDAMEEVNVQQPMSQDDIADAIDAEMGKIKVSGNESSAAKVNKYINEDGTYRLIRDDIDENFRITKIDRSTLAKEESNHVDEDNETFIPPFESNVERRVMDMEPPRSAITEIPDPVKYVINPIVMPEIRIPEYDVNQDNNLTKERELPVVVPERDTTHEAVSQEITYSTEPEEQAPIEFSGNFNAYLDKANILKNDLARIEEDYASEEIASQQTAETYQETLDRFARYVNGLEEQCNTRLQEVQVLREGTNAQQAQIDAMIEMMAQGSQDVEVKAARR